MNVFAGTYERFLFGFKVLPGSGDEVSLERYCTYAAHQHPVKCVASGGYYLASGGMDDQIHLYDVKRDKDLGFLMNPGDGAVPCIQFYCPPGSGGAPSHMFSGSADGSIAVWRAGGEWEHLKLMKGHTGSINALSIHPSGRLALSVAHDCHLRMWDLAKGRCTYVTKLDAESETVQFNYSGDAYMLLWGNKVTVHDVAGEGQLTAQLEHARKVTSITQLSETALLTGGEDGSIKVWDLRSNKIQHSIERAHTTRVRGLVTCSVPGKASSHLLCSAASDGVVKLWDVRCLSSSSSSAGAGDVPCLSEAATRARITCLTAVNKNAPGPKLPTKVAAPVAAAEEAKAPPTKAVAAGKQGKKAAGAQQQGKGKSEAGRQGGSAAKQVKARKPEPLGFEIVSEAKQAAHQKKRVARDSDDSDDEGGEADPAKLAKRKLGVTPKAAKKSGGAGKPGAAAKAPGAKKQKKQK